MIVKLGCVFVNYRHTRPVGGTMNQVAIHGIISVNNLFDPDSIDNLTFGHHLIGSNFHATQDTHYNQGQEKTTASLD